LNASHSVLVVDDSHAMTTILRRLLREIGYADVDAVHDAGAALESLRRKPYALMISDWEMPAMTGPQLVKAIRENPDLADPRMILITAHGLREDEAWLAGADGYLSKPFTAAMLREKIEEVFSAFSDQAKAASWMAAQRA